MPNQFKLFKYFQEVSWPTQLCLRHSRLPLFLLSFSCLHRPAPFQIQGRGRGDVNTRMIIKTVASDCGLRAVNAATMYRVPWFHDADSITDRPVVRFTTVKSSNQNSMDSIDNDFAHNRILRSDCNNSLHMPQSWVPVVMACAKIFSKVYPRWQLRNNFDFSSNLIWITLGKCLVKLAPRTPLNACLVGSIDLRIATCLPVGGKWWLVN